MEPVIADQTEPGKARAASVIVRKAGTPALLVLIVIGFFWKLTLTSQYTWLESFDMAYQVMPWQNVQALAFHNGQFPAWDPYVWGGQSLIGQAQPGTAYPLNWILYSLPLGNGHIRRSYLNWYLALIHVLAALFAYWLCRDLERSRFASLIGGVAFALAGAIGTTEWPQMLNGMIWTPLVLLFLFRVVRARRPMFSAALSGFFLGMSWLSGHHQVPIFLTYTVVGVWVFFIIRNRRIDWNLLKPAGVFVVFLALTGALQMLPAYEYGKLARRWVGAPTPVGWSDIVPYTVHRQHSLDLSTILGLMIPGVHGDVDPYSGFVILALSGLGIALWWNDIRVRVLLAAALAGLVCALGYQSVFHGFLYSVLPLLEKARSPAMAAFLFNFGAATLAAYGFDGLTTSRESGWPRRIALWSVCAGALMTALLVGVMTTRELHVNQDDRVVLVALVGLIFGALILAYQKGNFGRATLGVAILLLLLIDLGNDTGYAYVHGQDPNRATYLRQLTADPDILTWIRSQPGPFRVQLDGADVQFSYGDWFGVDVLSGYTASVPEHLMRIGKDSQRSRMLYGTKYWISRKPRDADQVEVHQFQGGLKAFESPGAFPRVWTVHQAFAISSESQISETFDGPEFDPRHQAFFLGNAPKLSSCTGEDQASLVHSDFNTVVIQADMRCAGMVILSDNWFPGWSATVDGRPARLWEADTAIRGVEVPSGSHRIEMRYHPLTVVLGAWMLALSLVGLGLLAWLGK